MQNISEIFGMNVFNEKVMRERLPNNIYKAIKSTIDTNTQLSADVASIVATAMKDWAIEKGATHYTHWFQPMTGITAEKHDSFISPIGEGKIIMEFSGKELIKGEPDASSFPSGGLRSTFEARGYTAWDPTSYAFVKDETLYIPTAFCSYSGEALDQKTPLIRSMEVLNTNAVRMLNIIGNPVSRVISTVGAEQEYFLINRDNFKKRKDLVFSGRTLFGAMPPKGQEMDDHYFGNMKDKVSAYMKDLDLELWKLGVYSKTKHNEVAPAQHELAPIFTSTNIASDHNQIIMELMKRIAKRHNLICLLHEKPFSGVNGSGKHNNWSISTDLGENLLSPGDDPSTNKQFLLILCAIIKAVDEYSEALRCSVATAGNDHRLGANEAPPAIISIFLGDHLSKILDCIQTGISPEDPIADLLYTGVTSIPDLYRDTTDRNRTSPFAFTGNKFEFRMVGSSQSISLCNIILNTGVAEVFSQFSEALEKANNIEDEINNLIKNTIINHGRIIFNGNNYSENWIIEAENRGLPNLKHTVDALQTFILPKNIELFTKHKVFTESEMHSRYEIMLESYCKTIKIESLSMLNIAKRQILPSCISYSESVFNALNSQISSKLKLNLSRQYKNAEYLSNSIDSLISAIDELELVVEKSESVTGALNSAKLHLRETVPAMQNLRCIADKLEEIVSSEYWPFPTYSELLFTL